MALDPTNSSRLVLLYDTNIHLWLDPVDVADNPESVAFNISLTWNMPFETHKLEARECWFETKALIEFESGLDKLLKVPQGSVILKDMSERPVLTVSSMGNTGAIIFSMTDRAKQGNMQFTMMSYALQIAEMQSKLRHYPKWW